MPERSLVGGYTWSVGPFCFGGDSIPPVSYFGGTTIHLLAEVDTFPWIAELRLRP